MLDTYTYYTNILQKCNQLRMVIDTLRQNKRGQALLRRGTREAYNPMPVSRPRQNKRFLSRQ